MCSHFYHGNTDPRDSTWLLSCEAIWDDPNPEKTKADEQRRANDAKLSEDTLIQTIKWETLKKEAMSGPEVYQKTTWWAKTTNYEKLILKRLIDIQTE